MSRQYTIVFHVGTGGMPLRPAVRAAGTCKRMDATVVFLNEGLGLRENPDLASFNRLDVPADALSERDFWHRQVLPWLHKHDIKLGRVVLVTCSPDVVRRANDVALRHRLQILASASAPIKEATLAARGIETLDRLLETLLQQRLSSTAR